MEQGHKLDETFAFFLNEKLDRIILSNPRTRDGYVKLILRPLILQGRLKFQAEEFTEKQAFHKNMSAREAAEYLKDQLSKLYRNGEIFSLLGSGTILVGKKGTVTVKIKKKAGGSSADQKTAAEKIQAVRKKTADISPEDLARLSRHNRAKHYVLPEGTPVPFLVDLGVMTKDGAVVKAKYDKFRQINRFLEFVEDILPRLDRSKETRIIDFGCGKSYLTFAMYYYLKELKGYPVRIIGLDLKEDVIRTCSRLAEKYGYENLTFLTGDIASYEGVDHVDMVVTLHACDTATDYALYKAVKWGAKVILSVPCCQHELNRQIENPLMKPVFGYGLIKERMAALYTDAIRAQVLEYRGYRTQILEFIDMEHTPKNILIRAVRQGNDAAFKKAREKTGTELRKLLEFLQADPAIVRLLAPELGTGERAGTDE